MFKLEKHQTAASRIKEEIVFKIISGDIKAGDRIKEIYIMKELGASRVTAREALLLLEQEGFIKPAAYKNIVTGIDYEELTNVFLPIRIIIEVHALRKFLTVATEKHFEFMEFQIKQMQWAREKENIIQVAEADLRFHECILFTSEMHNLISLWSSIYNRTRTYFFASLQAFSEELHRIIEGHQQLLEHIRNKDHRVAEEKLREHINDISWLGKNKK